MYETAPKSIGSIISIEFPHSDIASVPDNNLKAIPRECLLTVRDGSHRKQKRIKFLIDVFPRVALELRGRGSFQFHYARNSTKSAVRLFPTFSHFNYGGT